MTYLSITPPASALWQEAGALRDFPILEETRLRVRHKLQSKKVSFDDLAPIIERDPALCLNLLQVAAQQNPDCLPQISGAASCLSLLGMQELVRLMKHLPAIDPDTPDEQEQLYRRTLMTAHFAGNLAAWWAQIKGNPSPSYARWGAMLASAPLWAWLRLRPQSGNWHFRLSEGDDLRRASATVFGKDNKPWQLLARRLHLPQMATDMFGVSHLPKTAQWQTLRRHDPRDLNNQRPLLHLCQQPAMLALMANQLAWHLHLAPESKLSQRWLTLVAHWLGKPAFTLMADLRELQVVTSHQQNSTLGTGLHLLLSPLPQREHYPWIDAPDAAESAPVNKREKKTGVDFVPMDTRPRPAAPDDNSRHSNDDYMHKLLRQLQQPDSFGDWHYLMRGMLKGVTQGIGMPAACIALLNKDKTALKVFYAEGLSEQAPMRRFIVDLRKPSLFSKLLEKPASLLLTSDNRQRFLANMPDAVTSLLPQQTMMMSIDAGAAPIGLVMGFAADDQPPLSNSEYITFKNLCQMTSQGLAALRATAAPKRPSGRSNQA